MPWDVKDSIDFSKSDKMVIRVSRVNNGNGEKLDIRNHFLNSDGDWSPTKKGVSLQIVDSQCSAKTVLLAALKIAGVSQKEIEEHFEYERIVGED